VLNAIDKRVRADHTFGNERFRKRCGGTPLPDVTFSGPPGSAVSAVPKKSVLPRVAPL
jgi:hypothetical protein